MSELTIFQAWQRSGVKGFDAFWRQLKERRLPMRCDPVRGVLVSMPDAATH